jgi:hypothetical protein
MSDLLSDEQYATEVFGSDPAETESAPLGAPSEMPKLLRRVSVAEEAKPEQFARTRERCGSNVRLVSSASDDTTPARRPRRIIITDAVLLTVGAPADAKLAPAAILHFRGRGSPGIRDLEALLRWGDPRILAAHERAAEQGWLTVKSGHERKHPADKYFPKNLYTVGPAAYPTRDNPFVQLALTDELGTGPQARIIRAYYLREQRIAGAVQLPLGIAARVAGMTKEGERTLRDRWIASGALTKVRRGTSKRPPIFTVTSAEHPPDLEAFRPDFRQLGTVTTARGDELTVWGTSKERAKLTKLAAVDRNAYRLAQLAGIGALDAREAFDRINSGGSLEYEEAQGQAREAAEARLVAEQEAWQASIAGTRFDPASDDYDPFPAVSES